MKIGITGGIGSGKTLVSNYLRTLGAKVICADEITHMLYRPGKAGTLAIEKTFGSEYVNEKGVDRKKLGALVFNDAEQMKKLNDVMHPLIFETYFQAARHQKLVFFDAAIMIESGWHQSVDELWLVVCDDKVRTERLLERGMDDASIKKVFASQMTDEEKKEFADYIIDNSGDEMDTYSQVNAQYIALNKRKNEIGCQWQDSLKQYSR